MIWGAADLTGKRRALLIATDSYSDATFQQLRAPRADADALAAVFADPAIGGYEVAARHNPPAHEANLAIEDLFAAAWLDDLVLLYISGHGIKDDYGQLHLAMTNSRHDRLNATAVSAQFVRNQMDSTRSRRVVVLLDCCFAGAFPPGSTHRAGEHAGVLSQLGGRGSAVMTSSSALEYSFETGASASSTVVGTPSPSVFTGALVEGLRSGAADRNDDGLIDVDELYDFIYAQVEAAGKPQTPGLDSRFQGRLIVATSRAATELTPELGQAMRSPLPSVRLAIVGELSVLLNSDDASAARAAHTALARLTDDDSSSVAAAAQAALARAETATSPNTTTTVKAEVIEQNSAPSPAAPVTVPEPPTGGTPVPADSHGLAGQGEDDQRQRRRLWRTGLISAGIVVASATIIIAAVVLPGPGRSDEGGDTAAQPPQQTEQVRIPQRFVPPPKRPTPLPNPVTCQYQPDGKGPIRSVTPPASGEVPARGIVRATINTNIGAIPAILDRSLAPCTVNSFIHLAKQGFYDNTGCVSGAVPWLTCGPASIDGTGSPGYRWIDESIPELPYVRGYLTMPYAYYPDFDMAFEDHHMVDDTAFGTISEAGLKVIDSKRNEADDPSNERLSDIVVTNVVIQG